MAGSVNKVILVGNVGNDPEIRSTQDGKEIANFSIATTDSWKDKNTGERRDKTEWHKIVIFADGLVNVVKNYVNKGSRLYIEGALQTRKWTDANGVDKYTTEIVIQGYNSNLTILDSRQNSENQSFNKNNQSSMSTDAKSNQNVVEDLDDDIPF